jgi:hypothetical protein
LAADVLDNRGLGQGLPFITSPPNLHGASDNLCFSPPVSVHVRFATLGISTKYRLIWASASMVRDIGG